MFCVTISMIVALSLIWFIQFVVVLYYVFLLRTAKQPDNSDGKLPKFCIGMLLRGADPHLKTAIKNILKQDYPDFELRIIVDSANDPAVNVVKETVEELGVKNVHFAVLKKSHSTCSRYANKLVQYLEDVDGSCELVTFAAGDMLAPHDWLRNMAAAMSNPSVGATLGNRWYIPRRNWWGSLVRYLWNSAAVVAMWFYEIPWSGCLAMRISDVRRSGFTDMLKKGLVEDAQVKTAVDKIGLKMKFVPQLLIPNVEDIELGNSFRFIERQLFWTKQYHPRWFCVVFHALVSTVAMICPAIFSLWALLEKDYFSAALSSGLFVAYVFAEMLLLGLIEYGVRGILKPRFDQLPAFPLWRMVFLFPAIPLAQFCHLAAVLTCTFKQHVTWRGVTYHVKGPWDVKVVADDHSNLDHNSAEANLSI